MKGSLAECRPDDLGATIVKTALEQVPQLDVLLAPIGGGGLLSGLCVAAHALDPQMKVFACEPAGALDALHSVRQNRIGTDAQSSHDCRRPLRAIGQSNSSDSPRARGGIFEVAEYEIVEAMRFVFEHLKHMIEPSSAVAVAPLLRGEAVLAGKRVGVILTGGNVSPEQRRQAFMR